jgi:hypothetical protein
MEIKASARGPIPGAPGQEYHITLQKGGPCRATVSSGLEGRLQVGEEESSFSLPAEEFERWVELLCEVKFFRMESSELSPGTKLEYSQTSLAITTDRGAHRVSVEHLAALPPDFQKIWDALSTVAAPTFPALAPPPHEVGNGKP